MTAYKIKWSKRDRCYRIWERNEGAGRRGTVPAYACLEWMQFATSDAAQANIDLRMAVDEAVPS